MIRRSIALMPAFALMVGLANTALADVASVATPPTGSVWNTMASVISKEARRGSDLKFVVQPYGGNAAMMQAVQDKRAEFSLNDVNDVISAVAGSNDYDGNTLANLRIVARINPFPVGLYVREDSGMTHVSDLADKTVPGGWDAFPLGRSHIAAILAGGNLSYDSVSKVPVPELIRGSDAFAAGRVDSAFFAVGGPKVAEVNASVGGVRFLTIDNTPETLAAIQKVRPAFYISEVQPAPFRVGVPEAMPFVTWDNVLVAGAHVSDETVFELLKVMSAGQKNMGEAYPPLRAFAIERAYKSYPGVDYHPGAARFFAERGIPQAPAD